MSVKQQLTNERLNERFDNPFSLVNYAIKLARDKIARGEIDSSNLANDILELIVSGEDVLEIEEEREREDVEILEVAISS